MNGKKIKGICLIAAGSVQARFAHIVGNTQLGYAAHARIMNGRCSIAVGDAQEVIQRCIRRSASTQRAARGAAVAASAMRPQVASRVQ